MPIKDHPESVDGRGARDVCKVHAQNAFEIARWKLSKLASAAGGKHVTDDLAAVKCRGKLHKVSDSLCLNVNIHTINAHLILSTLISLFSQSQDKRASVC